MVQPVCLEKSKTCSRVIPLNGNNVKETHPANVLITNTGSTQAD